MDIIVHRLVHKANSSMLAVLDGGTGFLKVGYAAQVSLIDRYVSGAD